MPEKGWGNSQDKLTWLANVSSVKVQVVANMPNTNSVKKKIVGWDNIDWTKVDKYVFKLQKRIYTA